MIEYKQNNKLPEKYILNKLNEFWNEDFPNGDITTKNIIKNNVFSVAKIIAMEKLVFSGSNIIATNNFIHKKILEVINQKKYDIILN